MRPIILSIAAAMLFVTNTALAQNDAYKTISFEAQDGLQVTADLYMKHEDKAKPFIVLCHQAGWSRGEYREIAPKLGEMGFNCMAIDQRSGKGVNSVDNETSKRAAAAGKGTAFLDAEQDMVAALDHARKNYAQGKLILWGSSYRAALTLRIAGEHADKVDGALSFAPGEYFKRFGKPADYVAQSAAKIKSPVFITSAKNEYENWKSIFDAISIEEKTKFIPKSSGNHGSRALWKQFDDSSDYWKAAGAFLKKFL